MSSLVEIGFIGAGAATVCLLDALAQLDTPAGSMTIFEPSPYLWRGRPYQPDFDVVRVNAVPQDMSVRGGDDRHFAEWLTARGLMIGAPATVPDSRSGALFVPRAVYGDYLEQSARAALTRLAARGWRINLVRDRVDAATANGDGLDLHTGAGRRYTVGTVVLGVGAGRPADLYSLSGTDGFIAEPYPVSRSLAAVDPDAEVAVIGSGLTAVDVALSLVSRGHRGRIRFHSRHGVLPGVRQRPVHHRLRHFTPARFRDTAARGEQLTINDLLSVLKLELSAVGESLDPVIAEINSIRQEDPVSRLRRNLVEVDSAGVALRILQQAVPEVGPDVFPLLTEAERSAVLTEHHRTLMSLCCPMPPANAEAILSLLDSGDLEIVAGLTGIRPAGPGFVLDSGQRTDRADVVVNAVNARFSRINGKAGALVDSLVRAGLAQPHPRTGIHVDRATSRALTAAGPDPRVYALGDLAAGSLFFTFGVQSLVDRAVDIAAAITADARGARFPRASDDVLLPA